VVLIILANLDPSTTRRLSQPGAVDSLAREIAPKEFGSIRLSGGGTYFR
jgi:hypothetical protein